MYDGVVRVLGEASKPPLFVPTLFGVFFLFETDAAEHRVKKQRCVRYPTRLPSLPSFLLHPQIQAHCHSDTASATLRPQPRYSYTLRRFLSLRVLVSPFFRYSLQGSPYLVANWILSSLLCFSSAVDTHSSRPPPSHD